MIKQFSEEEIKKYICKLKDDKIIINKNDATNFFKRNDFSDIDIISELVLGSIKYNNNLYYICQNFGIIPVEVVEFCKNLLKVKKGLIFLWPKLKIQILSKIPVFLMDPRNNKGILIYIMDDNLLKI